MDFFETRLAQMGITEEINKFSVHAHNFDTDEPEERMIEIPVYQKHDLGIELNVWKLDRTLIPYDHRDANPQKANAANNRTQFYSLIRLENPINDKEGRPIKYRMPAHQRTWPFFPPKLVEKYEAKEQIENLFLTEGYFKAFKGSMHGLDIVGLSSISHYKADDTLYADIVKIIKVCKPKRIVILHDGDNKQLFASDKVIADMIAAKADVRQRVWSFYSNADALKDLLLPYAEPIDARVWYANIRHELEITHDDGSTSTPKGLDDLLIAMKGNEDKVVTDITSFDNNKRSNYTDHICIDSGKNKLKDYFNLRSVDTFYVAYQPYLKLLEFKYAGNIYQYNEKEAKVKMMVPEAAGLFARVGTDWYKKIKVPNKYGKIEESLKGWNKATIIEDFGKDFIQHIAKYEAFCNVPDHKNWQPAVHNCYNFYGEFEWEPEPGPYDRSLQFVKHIFGEDEIQFEGKTFLSYELGLDYIQLLYQRPTQILPILSLVSKERETGKSTFGNWMNHIFGSNAVFVGNDDWNNPFNSTYANKLLVMTEEAFLEKKALLEKIKSLSTAEKIQENRKGKEQEVRDFFGKFIFFSNNEENFLLIDKEETRFWVVKVPVISKADKENLNFKKELFDETPHFLDFLDKRQLVTKNSNRQWFHYDLTRTTALENVKRNSMSKFERIIRQELKEMFLDFNVEEILMTVKDINERFLSGKKEDVPYITRILENEFKVSQYKNAEGKFVAKRYKIPQWNDNVIGFVEMKPGRPYVFQRENIISAEDENLFDYESDIEIEPDDSYLPAPRQMTIPLNSDVPF